MDPATGEQTWRQFQKNTGQIDQKKAERCAEELEKATQAEYGAGDEKGKKMLGILREVADVAVWITAAEPALGFKQGTFLARQAEMASGSSAGVGGATDDHRRKDRVSPGRSSV